MQKEHPGKALGVCAFRGVFHLSLVSTASERTGSAADRRGIASGSNFAEGVLVKLPDPEIATTPLPPKLGALKFGWLRMLKNSARNCIENRSLIWKALNIEKSKRCESGGPVVVAGLPPSRAAPVARDAIASWVAGWSQRARLLEGVRIAKPTQLIVRVLV